MKAIVFDNKLTLKRLPEPKLQPGEALIRVQLAGICNTDLEILNGYMNFTGIPGHEFVGIVESVKESDPAWIGKRVVGEINFGCGTCVFCLKGLSRHCSNRTVLGILNHAGVFAEKVALPVNNLREVPKSITDEAAVFVEPLAACFEIFEQIKIPPDEPVVIIGDGKLGLLLAMAFQLHGCDVTVIGKHAKKLELAGGLGCKTCLVEAVQQQKFPIVVEASGNAAGFHLALDLLEPRGTIVLKSTYHGELTLNAAKIVVDEINVIGSRCGRFGPALRALAQNYLNIEKLITQVFSIDDFENAFSLAQSKESLKVLIKMN